MERESTLEAPADRPVTLRAAVLGLFVGWHLLFLPLSNAMQFFPRSRVEEKGDVVLECQLVGVSTSNRSLQSAYDAVGHLVDRWSEVSGQHQSWQMFCPELPPNSLFPVFQLETRNGSVVERESRYQPEHLAPGIRPPLLNYRYHHVEVHAVVGLWHIPPEWMESKPEAWRDAIATWIDARPGTIQSVLQRSVLDSAMPNDVERVTMILRFVSKPLDSSHSTPTVHDVPFVRWTVATGAWERYDAVLRTYVPVKGVQP